MGAAVIAWRASPGDAPARRKAAGFSLHELLVVVLILGIATGIAVPLSSGGDPQRVDLVAEEIATAIRFARSEAMRTGEVRDAKVWHDTERVRAAKPNIAGGDVSGVEFTLYNPADKKLYDFFVYDLPYASRITVINASGPFAFTGWGPRKRRVLFGPDGMPYWLEAGVRYPLASGTVSVGDGTHRRDVLVSPLGRVAVQ